VNYTTAMIQLPLVKESKGERLRTPEGIFTICEDLCHLAQETFQILCLNTKNYLINRHMITLGLADASLVHPREVFRPAIVESAAAIVLVHNHPSGDPTPSAEDIRITKQLIQAGLIIDIKLLDHVIIGRCPSCSQAPQINKTFLSMREEGLCEFA
jgi:DNA repair protein RadC